MNVPSDPTIVTTNSPPTEAASRRWWLPRRPWVRWTLAVGFALALGWVAVTAHLFIWPPSSEPHHADAIVVFAGGRGERLDRARQLLRLHVAPTLVISNGRDPKWHEANKLCDAHQSFRVLCPQPQPDTTRGEARTVAGLARSEGLRSLVLVTSTYHATRAGILLRRCFTGHVDVATAQPREGVIRMWLLAIREELAVTDAELIHRGC